MHIQQTGQTTIIDSTTFTARFEGACLVSVLAKPSGLDFCRSTESGFPVELFYVGKDVLGADKHQQVTVVQLSPLAARLILSGNDSERELFLRLDPSTGDLCVTPSGNSARRGLVSVRWNIAFAPEASLILPCINGMSVQSTRAFPANDRFPWPFRWNAQLAIAERAGCALMVHSEDTASKFKALNLVRAEDGASTLGFESEQVGPLWENRAAGGIEWRLNVYEGDWRTPADRYRTWMTRAYALAHKAAQRPEWVEQIGFTLQWASPTLEVLEALARLYPPHKTLIHLAAWRTDGYDINYPTYTPNPQARRYMEQASALGYRVMPHFNYFSCYNQHPLFPTFRDWQLRDPLRNEPQGWYYPFNTHDYTRMGYIHPGLSQWRRALIDAVLTAQRELQAPAVFLDQTLCTWNTDNGLVENMTTFEGLWRMQEEFSAIQPELVLAGEGLNEISFQRQCFAQGHIHDGWSGVSPQHVEAAHGICAYLWRACGSTPHTRLMGYYHINPEEKDVELGIEIYRRMGAIPSLQCNKPELITPTQPVIKLLLELAGV